MLTTTLTMESLGQPTVEKPPAHQPPQPPDGYVVKSLDAVRGTLPIPQEWHWKVQQTPQAMNYYATKEDIDLGMGFKTGMTIWVVSPRVGIEAASFGKEWAEGLVRHGTLIDSASNSTPPFVSFAYRIRNTTSPDQIPLIIQHTSIANTNTRTVYLIVFESPEADWENAWAIGRTMMSGLVLDPGQ